jgi:hypothetical protein
MSPKKYWFNGIDLSGWVKSVKWTVEVDFIILRRPRKWSSKGADRSYQNPKHDTGKTVVFHQNPSKWSRFHKVLRRIWQPWKPVWNPKGSWTVDAVKTVFLPSGHDKSGKSGHEVMKKWHTKWHQKVTHKKWHQILDVFLWHGSTNYCHVHVKSHIKMTQFWPKMT